MVEVIHYLGWPWCIFLGCSLLAFCSLLHKKHFDKKRIYFVPIMFALAITLLSFPIYHYFFPIIFVRETGANSQNLLALVALTVTFLSSVALKMTKDATDNSTKIVNDNIFEFKKYQQAAAIERRCFAYNIEISKRIRSTQALANVNQESYNLNLAYHHIVDLFVSTAPSTQFIKNLNFVAQYPVACSLITEDMANYFMQLKELNADNHDFVSAIENLLRKTNSHNQLLM